MNASVDTLDMILKRKHVDDKLNPSKRSKAKLTKRHSPCLNERSLYDFFPLASRKCLNTRKDMMLQCAASSSHLKSNHLPSTSDLSKQTTRLHVAAVTVNHETKTTPPLTLELGCEEDVSNVLHDDELRKPILKQMSRRFSLKGPSITNEEKESSPMTGRCLFGPVDHESLSNFLAGELKSMREKKVIFFFHYLHNISF